MKYKIVRWKKGYVFFLIYFLSLIQGIKFLGEDKLKIVYFPYNII